MVFPEIGQVLRFLFCKEASVEDVKKLEYSNLLVV